MTQQSARPDRTLVAIVSVIAAIVVIAIVVVFTRGGQSDVDPASPEGAVQSYSQAIVDSDFEAARTFIAEDVLAQCERADPSALEGLRMTVISSTVNGETATVRVSLEHGSGTFGGSSYQYDDLFTLVKEDSRWKIETAPWELALCSNQGFSE
ncbi:MAG: nuclear transport factor 2 family protein [Actinomycetales bacterium]|tara:strand:- start:3456 stop:3914 length:459 start_codon:yes stop_codon:yes gene_type:complete